ncbi:hypothetical protein AB0K51_12440 [Kitasatospora sp. NPDC049285]|uniref:hypothetical protein n=1 Tax=Kitasatospora sp. NPDC049285 TaxID=3157096 RepID=UPI003441C75E
MTADFPYPVIDPSANQIIVAVGRKGSGKSAAAREHFRGWPATDRYVIDINGSADPGDDQDVIVLRGQPPHELPPRQDPAVPVTVRWIADPAADTFEDDVDRALAAALYPKDRRVLVWVDEMGEVFKAGRTGRNGRLLLHQSRHHKTSALLCGPRPKGVDPLVMAQADRVLMFDLPNTLDVARIAENIGIAPGKLAAVLNETARRGAHWSTLYVAEEHRLYRVPPFQLT